MPRWNFILIILKLKLAFFLTNQSLKMESNLISNFAISSDSDFTIHNIPFAVFSFKSAPSEKRCASRIGDFIIDLSAIESNGLFSSDCGLVSEYIKSKNTIFLNENSLNKFMELGKPFWSEIRKRIQYLVSTSCNVLNNDLSKQIFHPVSEVIMHLPAKIGDYTDFYSSYNHAYNVGCIIRGPNNAIQANWLHLPVAYHGRASTVVISGTPIIRPRGQIKPPDSEQPIFSECKRMDFELEIGAFIGGKTNSLGHPIKVNEAENNIFGLVLSNDWSARDIQTWEYVPLGPFLAKNFATTISPWIVTLEALEPFRVELSKQDPEPLPYLKETRHSSYDIALEVSIQGEKMNSPVVVSKSNFKYLYWSLAQQLAHHSVTGCTMNPGDMIASGTISGKEKSEFGSMLELSWAGKEPLKLTETEVRTFINNGDTVTMKGWAEKNGIRVGFGECVGEIKPALDLSEFY